MLGSAVTGDTQLSTCTRSQLPGEHYAEAEARISLEFGALGDR